jgi:predicted enzyme related to lactoylglutathione lyase
MGMIGGLFHVAIKTSDLSQALAFYREIRGLQEAPHPSAGEGSLARNRSATMRRPTQSSC